MRAFFPRFVVCSLFAASCSYDYSALVGTPDAGQGRGASGGIGPMSLGTGGIKSASGGQVGTSTGGSAPATGGETGTGGVASGGVSGTDRNGTGGLGGTGGGVTGQGAGGSGAGGQGLGGNTGAPNGPRILSIDFVGGYAVVTGGAGGGGASGTGGTAGAGGTAGVSGGGLLSLPIMGQTEIAGAKPASHWNGASNVMNSLGGLVLADGSATTATVTWNSPPSSTGRGVWWLGYADAPGDVHMMNGYLDPHSTTMPNLPATVAVSGLPTSITTGGYDVYVYVSGEVPSGITRTFTYSIGTTSFTVSQTGPSPTMFGGYKLAPAGGAGNYIVFRSLTDPTFTLFATPGTGGRAPVNGIQIVSPAGS